MGESRMTTFRYYLLDGNGKIACADFLDSADLDTAIVQSTEAAQKLALNGVCGVEVWQDKRRMHRAVWPSALLTW